jgi:hypothetical protein
VEKKDYYPASSAQKRLYFLQQFESESPVYHIFGSSFLSGEPNLKKLNNIVQRLLIRHDSFRTCFEVLNELPVQRVVAPGKINFEIAYDDLTGETGDINLRIKIFVRPFDLSSAPLLRVELVKTSRDEHLLLFDMHHIISDGASHLVLQEEIMSLSREEELPALRLQYKDFSHWQNSREHRETISKQKAYWVEAFFGEIPVLNLPFDYPRTIMESFEGAAVHFVLNAEETGVIKQIAGENNVTLNIAVRALFNVLLAKLSDQEDIVVGMPVFARRHSDLEKIIGMFVNALAIRSQPKGELTFREFVEQVKTVILAAYENQEYQFEELVENISVTRDARRNPLFDVMVNMLNQGDNRGETPAFKDEDEYKHIAIDVKFDLIFTVEDFGETMYCNFEYCSKLFKANTIERFIKYFKTVIHRLTGNMDRQIATIEIISEEERQQILHRFNETQRDYPRDKTVHECFENQVEKFPAKIALSFNDRQLTYEKLNERSNRLAGVLRVKGVKTGAVVGMMTERSEEMITGILAVLKAGGAYLPVSPGDPVNRIEYLLEDADVSFLLIDGKSIKKHSFTALQGLKSVAIQPCLTAPRSQVTDLDALPLPDRS